MNRKNWFRKVGFACRVALGCAAATMSNSTHAAFHLWNIRELFTNPDGTQQFIEFFDTFGGQQFVGGQQIQVTDQAGTTTHTFTIPESLPGESFGHAFLIATSGFASAAGAVTPNFTMPAGFLFPDGGTINFFGLNSGSYSALPKDGILSRDFDGNTDQSNSPQNFAGSVGHVVPESTTWALLGLGGIAFCFLFRRRAA